MITTSEEMVGTTSEELKKQKEKNSSITTKVASRSGEDENFA